jgi:hypothetical protein
MNLFVLLYDPMQMPRRVWLSPKIGSISLCYGVRGTNKDDRVVSFLLVVIVLIRKWLVSAYSSCEGNQSPHIKVDLSTSMTTS